ncbi:aspartate--tRNA ligase [Striga asiatica]|uniref:Aspartate--tRNA ligase n=1 Tax=Striga asiatica TaxID=4170 RepID=A0A5A7R7X0_STRAF|nr:aspartate--tRNA ligase [Striga asiatica]
MATNHRIFLLKPLSQLPDFRVHPCREPDLRILPSLRPLVSPHLPVFNILLIILNLLNHVMVERVKRPLESNVHKIRQVAQHKNPKGIDLKSIRELAIDKEEEIPGDDTSPDENMLYPGEVGHGKGNLGIYGPDDTCHHGSPHGNHVGRLATGSESLVVIDYDVEEEDDEGCVEAIGHPPEYPLPVEEEVLRALLVKGRELHQSTSCSKTPREMTGNDVRTTLNSSMYQSSYTDCPEKPANASK